MNKNQKWDLVFFIDDECENEWKRVKDLTYEQKKVLSNIMLEMAGYCFHWVKSSNGQITIQSDKNGLQKRS